MDEGKSEEGEGKMNKYRVYFTNHGYYACRNFDTVQEALAYGRTVGFQFQVQRWDTLTDRVPVASWCPISGHRYYEEVAA